jgi:hypothetical protein
MLEPGEIVAGRYQVLRTLGAGGMGVVFEALELETQAPVAIKCLHPDVARMRGAAQRFAREAEAIARVHHPNVVSLHEFGEYQGQLYLVLERLRGVSLRAFMRGRQLSREEACRVLLPVLRGVAAAHAAGVLHCDLKPENIFLAEPGQGRAPVPKVLDFGLARLRDPQSFATLGISSPLLGTYRYMAPEQLRAQGALDERADVYALGAIAYELLTGELPYRASNPVDLALQLLESEAVLATYHVPSLPEGLALALARALSRDRALRFPSVKDFANVLAAFDGRASPAAPLSQTAGAPRPVADLCPGPTAAVRPARLGAWVAVVASLALGLCTASYELARRGHVARAISTVVHAQDPGHAWAPRRAEHVAPAWTPVREEVSAPAVPSPREEARAAAVPQGSGAGVEPASAGEPGVPVAAQPPWPLLRGPAVRGAVRASTDVRARHVHRPHASAGRDRMHTRSGGPSSVLRLGEF